MLKNNILNKKWVNNEVSAFRSASKSSQFQHLWKNFQVSLQIAVGATICQITADSAQIWQQIDVTANQALRDENFQLFHCLFEQSMKSYLLWKSLCENNSLCKSFLFAPNFCNISQHSTEQWKRQSVWSANFSPFRGKTLCATEIWSWRDLISRFFGGAALMALAGVQTGSEMESGTARWLCESNRLFLELEPSDWSVVENN